MASRRTLLAAAAMTLVAAAALLPTTASNKTFIVGDDAGWTIGVDYKAWARGKKFKIGDTLVFKPDKTRKDDVVLVDEVSFSVCVSPNNSIVLSSAGKPYVGRIVHPGKYFFICDTKGACESGMKLTINAH